MLALLLMVAGMSTSGVCGADATQLQEWHRGRNAVIVCGDPDWAPAPSRWHRNGDGSWAGENLTVFLVAGNQRTVIATTDVLEPVRVVVKLPRIVVTEYTYACAGHDTPFVETSIDLAAEKQPRTSVRVLLRKHRWNDARVEQLVARLRSFDVGKHSELDLSSLLCELRDFGVDRPAAGLAAFRQLKTAPWNDGGNGEEYEGYVAELKRVAAIPATQH